MSQRALPSILVVEDDLDLRQTIVASLESNGFAAAQAADAADALERLRSFAYDGLVVDLRLPDADGMTVLDEALDRYPEIRAVVMTGFGGVAEAVTAIKRGAVDFLVKPTDESELMGAVMRALTRDVESQVQKRSEKSAGERYARLTVREKQVCQLVAEGWLNKQIAAALGTAEKTVKQHRGRVMRKLELQSVAALVRFLNLVPELNVKPRQSLS